MTDNRTWDELVAASNDVLLKMSAAAKGGRLEELRKLDGERMEIGRSMDAIIRNYAAIQ